MPTIIKVFDENEYLNNVITPLSIKVDQIIYVYHHHQNQNQIKNLETVLKRYGDFKITFYQLENDEDEIEIILKNHPNFIVDISSNRYLTMVLFEKALKYNQPIIYYDGDENVIKDYRKHTVIVDHVFSLTIEDLLRLSGGEIKNYMHKPPNDKKLNDLIKAVVEDSFDNYSGFVTFIQKVNHLTSRQDDDYGSYISKENQNKLKGDPLYHKYAKYKLFQIEDQRLVYQNNVIKSMFQVSGSWLEAYLYLILKESGHFDDVMMSVMIDFSDAKNNTYPIICEVDGIVLKNNRLCFMSSKSNKVETDALNEIKTHQERFGNRLSHPVICTLEELSDKNPSIFLKAQGLKIAVLEYRHFKDKIVVKLLDKVINNTYTYLNKL